jgi:hypothetical protein
MGFSQVIKVDHSEIDIFSRSANFRDGQGSGEADLSMPI